MYICRNIVLALPVEIFSFFPFYWRYNSQLLDWIFSIILDHTTGGDIINSESCVVSSETLKIPRKKTKLEHFSSQ